MNARRKLIVALGAGALTASRVARAQQPPTPLPRAGFLISETVAGQASRISALRAGLADRGHIDGKTIAIEIRSAEGNYDRLPALAAELVALNVDVLVTFGIKALDAASKATATTPIVIPSTSSDPIALGLVSSHARPGGNVTGSTTFGPEIMAKRLQLAKEVRPETTLVGVLVNPANTSFGPTFKQMDPAAQGLKVALNPIDVKSPREFERVFAAMAKARVDAIVIQDDTIFGEANAKSIANLAARHRVFAIGNGGFAEAGGAIGYGSNESELYRRGAYFIDRILKGANAGDLPIEQATRFELVINMKAMNALGIRVPQAVLVRAERVIQG